MVVAFGVGEQRQLGGASYVGVLKNWDTGGGDKGGHGIAAVMLELVVEPKPGGVIWFSDGEHQLETQARKRVREAQVKANEARLSASAATSMMPCRSGRTRTVRGC